MKSWTTSSGRLFNRHHHPQTRLYRNSGPWGGTWVDYYDPPIKSKHFLLLALLEEERRYILDIFTGPKWVSRHWKGCISSKILCTRHVIAVVGDAQTYAQLDDFKQKLNLEWRQLPQGDGVLPTASSHTWHQWKDLMVFVEWGKECFLQRATGQMEYQWSTIDKAHESHGEQLHCPSQIALCQTMAYGDWTHWCTPKDTHAEKITLTKYQSSLIFPSSSLSISLQMCHIKIVF